MKDIIRKVLKEETDDWWERNMKIIKGDVEGWNEMSDEEKIKYRNPDFNKLEIEFEKLTNNSIVKSILNWKLYLTLQFMVNTIKQYDKKLSFEIMFRVTEGENPIHIIKDIHNRYNLNTMELGSWKNEIIKTSNLSYSINPYVDYVEELN